MKNNPRKLKGIVGAPMSIESAPTSWKNRNKTGVYGHLLRKKQTSGVSPEEHIQLIRLAKALGKLPAKDADRIVRKLKTQQSQQVADKVDDL